MKKFSLVLFVSLTCLTACGDDKAQATNTTMTTATTPAETAPTATPAVEHKTVAAESSGEELHQANCTRCHANIVYTRDDRKVTSLDGLKKQVQMCDTQLETQLFPEDLDKVVTYLNETFYKF